MLHFDWPWMLILLPLPWLIRRFTPHTAQQSATLYAPVFSQFGEQSQAQASEAPTRLLPLWIIWGLLLAAACRPLWLGEPVGRPLEGRDMVIAVDLSGSMSTEDMELNGRSVDRLTMVKSVLSEFIARRQGDRLGLVLFGDSAYLQAPLTFDRTTVSHFLDETVLGLVGRSTAIGDAIGVSLRHMLEQETEQRVLILLTDGQNTAGQMQPLEAAKLAAQEKVTIYAIGVGADEMVRRSFIFSQRVNPSADLDEATLTELANMTGGAYFRARDTQSLAEIYQTIDSLQPIASEEAFYRPEKDLFYWCLGAALLVAMLILPVMVLRRRA